MTRVPARSDRPVVLVTGGGGQIGRELLSQLSPIGEIVAPGREQLDLASSDSIRAVIRATRPSVVVNAAAWTGKKMFAIPAPTMNISPRMIQAFVVRSTSASDAIPVATIAAPAIISRRGPM